MTAATPQTLGFLFMAVAGLIISVVILQSQSFGQSVALGKAAGYAGIIGFIVALASYISWIVAPSIAEILMPISGLLWLIWWLIVSVSLFKLAKVSPEREADSTSR